MTWHVEQLIEQLVSVGLSRKEASVYLAVLETGRAGANVIARRAKIARATAYAVLDQLKEKGLVTPYVEQGEKRFRAEHPEQLERLLDLQLLELKERRHRMKELMPRLAAFYNAAGVKPKVRYFEGLQGLRRVQAEFEQFADDIIQIVSLDTFRLLQDPQMSKQHQDSITRRRNNVRSILITERQVSLPETFEYVTIPPSAVPIEGEMTVCGDRLVLFSYASNIMAIEIQSRVIAETARAALELAWREAKRIGV